jgi:hypothetical protein
MKKQFNVSNLLKSFKETFGGKSPYTVPFLLEMGYVDTARDILAANYNGDSKELEELLNKIIGYPSEPRDLPTIISTHLGRFGIFAVSQDGADDRVIDSRGNVMRAWKKLYMMGYLIKVSTETNNPTRQTPETRLAKSMAFLGASWFWTGGGGMEASVFNKFFPIFEWEYKNGRLNEGVLLAIEKFIKMNGYNNGVFNLTQDEFDKAWGHKGWGFDDFMIREWGGKEFELLEFPLPPLEWKMIEYKEKIPLKNKGENFLYLEKMAAIFGWDNPILLPALDELAATTQESFSQKENDLYIVEKLRYLFYNEVLGKEYTLDVHHDILFSKVDVKDLQCREWLEALFEQEKERLYKRNKFLCEKKSALAAGLITHNYTPKYPRAYEDALFEFDAEGNCTYDEYVDFYPNFIRIVGGREEAVAILLSDFSLLSEQYIQILFELNVDAELKILLLFSRIKDIDEFSEFFSEKLAYAAVLLLRNNDTSVLLSAIKTMKGVSPHPKWDFIESLVRMF